jgi:hypothetical protein
MVLCIPIDATGRSIMSLSIAEALEQVELEPGRTYSCQVKGHWVELRVFQPGMDPRSTIDESDIRLDPWVELNRPTPGIYVRARRGTLPLPDVIEITPDDIMLDPWVELPPPTPTMRVVGRFEPIPQPDIPPMPTDQD